MTERENELMDGMIEVQQRHAQHCDDIANRPMAEKQKAWDLERVALLEKLRADSIRMDYLESHFKQIFLQYPGQCNLSVYIDADCNYCADRYGATEATLRQMLDREMEEQKERLKKSRTRGVMADE